MKRSVMKRTLLPFLAIVGLFMLTAAAPKKQLPSYSTEVAVEPSAVAGAYVVKVKVRSLLTGDIIAGSALNIAAGRPVKAKSTLEGSETVVSMSAMVEGTHAASYAVTIKAGDQVVSEHTAKVQL